MEKEIIAKLNRLRIAPRKIRLLADLIRGKKIEKARSLLSFTVKRGSVPLLRLLDSAAANAKNNFNLDEKGLFIKVIKVDEGATLRRWRARSRGRANRIEKKTSHITIVLDSTEKGKTAKKISNKKTEKDSKAKDSSKKAKRAKKSKIGEKNIKTNLNKNAKAASAKVFMRKSIST